MKASESILVVDDDLDFLSIIKSILGSKGYKVETASSASDAISRLEERFYNTAILDISLPDADGTDLLSRIIQIHPEIIAIMLTGHSSVQNAMQSLNSGAFAYLEKPLDPETLLSIIGRGLEKQSLVMENRQLMEELERHNHITNTLLNVSQAVSQSLDLQNIIDLALVELAQSTGLEAGFVYINDNERLPLMGAYGLSRRVSDAMPKEINKGDTILRRIFEEARPVIIEDMTKEIKPDLDFLSRGGYRSFAGVPLAILGKSIGVLGVATSFVHYFSSNNIDLLIGIGREIAIAVRNAQLYEEASSAKALRELDIMRTEFLANVSHELRTPLAVIKGSANSPFSRW